MYNELLGFDQLNSVFSGVSVSRSGKGILAVCLFGKRDVPMKGVPITS